MNLLKTLLSICLIFCYFFGISQENKTDYIEFNDRKNVVHGIYLGITTHYGEINNKDTYFAGVKVAYVANQQFEVGLAGTIFYSEQDFYKNTFSVDEDLFGGYGGQDLEPILFSKSKINLSFPMLIGVGAIGYIGDDFDNDPRFDDDFDDVDAIFVFEPGVNFLFNISRYLQLEAGAKYRFSNKFNIDNSDISRLNGFSAGIGIKVGVFNMGRNRYKKNIDNGN